MSEYGFAIWSAHKNSQEETAILLYCFLNQIPYKICHRVEDRIYICDCGNILDRDLNASINLEKYGLIKIKNTESSSEIKACGESVRLLEISNQEAVSLKQEENIKCSI